jgi:hypothetical protein
LRFVTWARARCSLWSEETMLWALEPGMTLNNYFSFS